MINHFVTAPLSLGLLDVTFISHELLGHIHLELERFSFCPEFHAFYIGEFGQRINRHSDEKGFRCSAFDLVDLTREVGDSRSVPEWTGLSDECRQV